MARVPDSFMTAPSFKKHLKDIDHYAKNKGLDKWAARISWVGLVYNVLVAKRFAQRRPRYAESRAWKCYDNLIQAGVFSEDPEGIVYAETPLYETDEGVVLWVRTLIHIADGGEAPAGFPRHGYRDQTQ